MIQWKLAKIKDIMKTYFRTYKDFMKTYQGYGFGGNLTPKVHGVDSFII